MGMCRITKQGDPAVENKGGEGCASVVGVCPRVRDRVDYGFDNRVPSLPIMSVYRNDKIT